MSTPHMGPPPSESLRQRIKIASSWDAEARTLSKHEYIALLEMALIGAKAVEEEEAYETARMKAYAARSA